MDNKHQTAWENCLEVIRDNVPVSSYRTWFEPIVPVKLKNNVLTIQVPSAFFYEYLEELFIDILKKTLRMVLGSGAKLEYNVVVSPGNMGASDNNGDPYTVSYPTSSSKKIQNKPLTVPLLPDEKRSIRNPFI